MRKILSGVFVCLLVLLLIPNFVFADGDPPEVPIDDEFIDTLVLIMTNQDVLKGNLDASSLVGLRDVVDEYYLGKMVDVRNAKNANDSSNGKDDVIDFHDDDDPDIQALMAKKNATIDKIDARINDPLLWVVKLFDLLTESDELDKQTSPITKIVSGNDQAPLDYFDTMYSSVMTRFDLQMNILFNIDTQNVVQVAVADDSVEMGQVSDSVGDSISDSSSDINDDSSTTIGDSLNRGASSSSTSSGNEKKTQIVSFQNNGFETVMVKVESYFPLEGMSNSMPSSSTVVGSESNSSASLELPLGEYVFCYEWDLARDDDGDGKTDYHHRTTNTVMVGENSTSIVVTLNPDSVVSNPNGRCGETSFASNETQNSSLSAEELANSGTFYYVTSCQGLIFGVSCNNDALETLHIAVTFDEGGVVLEEISGESDTLYYPKVAVNQYSGSVDGIQYTIIFSMDGFHYTFVDTVSSTNATLIFMRK